jgi:PAP2 superfamily
MTGALAHAQPTPAEPAEHGWRLVGSDAKAYVTAPLHAGRKQWVRFGSVVAAVGFAYHYDDRVRRHFVPDGTPPTGTADTRDAHDALPAAAMLGGTWLAATLGDNDDGRHEARDMFEAAAFGSAANYLLKAAAGRERPYVAGDSHGFGNGGDSFPSMHVTAAFAIGTVFAESGNPRYRWLRRTLGYGMAAATAYARMDHDAHWFSDTVAGASIGIATARFVLQRENRARAFAVLPSRDGLTVAFAVPLDR